MRRLAKIFFLAFLILVFPHYAWSYNLAVSINTTTLSGTSGLLAFEFLDSDATANNSLQISQLFTDGTFGSTTLVGDTAGSPSGGFSLADSGFDNRVEQQLTFGSFLKFELHTTNLLAPGGLPDSVAFSILDQTTGFSVFATDDPFGLGALFVVNLDGSNAGVSIYSDLSGNTPWTVEPLAAVPLPSAMTLFITGIAGLGISGYRRQT